MVRIQQHRRQRNFRRKLLFTALHALFFYISINNNKILEYNKYDIFEYCFSIITKDINNKEQLEDYNLIHFDKHFVS